jgi:hypothetical protein
MFESISNFYFFRFEHIHTPNTSKVGQMKSPIRYEENNFFITKYFLLFS